MEENITNKEQPDTTCSVNVAAASEVSSNDESSSGSLYGKFKDAESLYNGYKELEKEFTKKSQLLSELKSNAVDNTAKVPIYETENWQSEIDNFLSNNKYANDFAKDMAQTLMQDKDLACMPNCLDLAYNKVVAKKYLSQEDMAKDENFLNNYIYNNEEIRSKIVGGYLNDLKKNSAPPIVIQQRGDTVGVITPTKPKDLSEARKLVEQLFGR